MFTLTTQFKDFICVRVSLLIFLFWLLYVSPSNSVSRDHHMVYIEKHRNVYFIRDQEQIHSIYPLEDFTLT